MSKGDDDTVFHDTTGRLGEHPAGSHAPAEEIALFPENFGAPNALILHMSTAGSLARWRACAVPVLMLFPWMAARGQPPTYTVEGIVNASDYSAGPFAPNSVLSLFGARLVYSEQPVPAGSCNSLPVQIAGASVLLEKSPVTLLAVVDCGSYQQINFLVPSNQIPGKVKVQVVRQGVAGPAVFITLVTAAPALFEHPGHANYAIAQDWSAGAATMTPDAPALPGDWVVLYATGLGPTHPAFEPGEVPGTAAYLNNWNALQVLLDGKAIDSSMITYAGLTPFCMGLYQVNFRLPGVLAEDPEIRLSFAGETSKAAMKLAVKGAGHSAD
jgi:uncharacterized protein (TIGR03437 family)